MVVYRRQPAGAGHEPDCPADQAAREECPLVILALLADFVKVPLLAYVTADASNNSKKSY